MWEHTELLHLCYYHYLWAMLSSLWSKIIMNNSRFFIKKFTPTTITQSLPWNIIIHTCRFVDEEFYNCGCGEGYLFIKQTSVIISKDGSRLAVEFRTNVSSYLRLITGCTCIPMLMFIPGLQPSTIFLKRYRVILSN